LRERGRRKCCGYFVWRVHHPKFPQPSPGEKCRDSTCPSDKQSLLFSSPGGVSRISRGRYSGPVKFVKHFLLPLSPSTCPEPVEGPPPLRGKLFTPSDETAGARTSAGSGPHGCRSASWRYRHVPAFPESYATGRHLPANVWQMNAAGYGATPSW